MTTNNMYYPILRARQFELIALRELAENKNRRCTMPFGTKEFMKLMNLAIWY
jgi:hypothetical protein